MLKKDGRALRAAIVLFAVLLRIAFWNTAPVTGDGAIHFTIVKHMAETHTIPSFEYYAGPDPFWYPPLYHLLSALIYNVTGVLTISPLIFGIASVFAFDLFLKTHFRRLRTAGLGFFALLPYALYYSGIGYADSLLLLLAILFYDFYLKYEASGKGYHLALTLLFAVALANTHYQGFIPSLAVAVHMGLKNPKKAVFFLAAVCILSSPWYVRNYILYGNPVWPKIFPGNFPGDRAVQSLPLADSVASLFTIQKWGGVFFDFWVGAPNSGEDMLDNIEVGMQKVPFFLPAFALWLGSLAILSYLFYEGVRVCPDKKIKRLALLSFAASIAPFLGNSLARMFYSFIPFIPVFMAYGFLDDKGVRRTVIVGLCLFAAVGSSFGYALVYSAVRAPVIPFFHMMEDSIGEDKNVLMPESVGECLYFSQKRCIRLGSAGGVPNPRQDHVREDVAKAGIDYVCCSNLNWGAHSEVEKRVCTQFFDQTPDISYESGGYWGKCWKVK